MTDYERPIPFDIDAYEQERQSVQQWRRAMDMIEAGRHVHEQHDITERYYDPCLACMNREIAFARMVAILDRLSSPLVTGDRIVHSLQRDAQALLRELPGKS